MTEIAGVAFSEDATKVNEKKEGWENREKSDVEKGKKRRINSKDALFRFGRKKEGRERKKALLQVNTEKERERGHKADNHGFGNNFEKVRAKAN